MMKQRLLILLFTFYTTVIIAGEADVLDVKIRLLGNDSYRIDATVKHADTGWDHYANGWEVLDENGKQLGKRVLFHPHVDEQPFTRSDTVTIPEHVKMITVRAIDSVHETGGNSISIQVPGK